MAAAAYGLVFWALPARAAQTSVEVFGAAVKLGAAARVGIHLTSDDPVEGFRLAIRVDPAAAEIDAVSIGGTAAAGAERAILRFLPDRATFDVLLDAEPPFAGQTIPPGNSQPIVFLQVQGLAAAPGAGPLLTPIAFASEIDGSPFAQAVRVAGREVGPAEGLVLIDGMLSIFPISDDLLSIPDLAVDCLGGEPIAVPVLLTNGSGPVQAFSLSVEHDPAALVLKGIDLEGTVTRQKVPEYIDVDLYPTGGTIGVVLDLFPPFEGQTIPFGNNRPIARYLYDAADLEAVTREGLTTSFRFVDDVFGEPLLSNLLVVRGNTKRPTTVGGSLTLFPCEVGPIQFCVGAPASDGSVVSPFGFPGQECLRVSLFYRSPFFLQGLQMAIAFHDCLTGVEGSLQLVDPAFILAFTEDFTERQIDFVSYHFDNSQADGDGRELVLGLLVEALPPFEDKRLRDSEVPLKFADICFQVCENIPTPALLFMEFREGLDGRGRVRIFNRAVVDDQAVRPEFCQRPVVVVERHPPPGPPAPEFIRGDCNGNGGVQVSDAAAVAAVFGYLHLPDGALVYPDPFTPPCEDACDANDDGRIDLADLVSILRYLFKHQIPLPAPGPVKPGPDPSEDKLTCNL